MEYTRLRSLEEFDSDFVARYGTAAQGDALFPPLPGSARDDDRPVFAGLTGGQLQKISAWVQYGVMALLVLGVLLLVVPKIFGVQYKEIESGSMRPAYEVGALVVVVPTEFEKIKKGDDITYIVAENMVSTHRVIEVYENKREVIVRGIHDSEFMENVKEENLLGVVRFSVPRMGRWLNIAAVRWGTLGVLGAIYILAWYIGRKGKRH